MKSLFLLILFASLFLTPAYGQISDRTGLKHEFIVNTGGYEFLVELVANSNVEYTEFSAEEKKLTVALLSNTEKNLIELQIPKNLINGEFTFFLNDQEVFPEVQTNDEISFIFLEFDGSGLHKLEIIGTTYLPEFAEIASLILVSSFASIVILSRFTNYSFSID